VPILIHEVVGRVAVVPLDDAGPAATVTVVGEFATPEAAVMALLAQYGFNRILLAVLQRAEVPDETLGAVMRACEDVETARWQKRRAEAKARAAELVAAAAPGPLVVHVDPDDDSGDGDDDVDSTPLEAPNPGEGWCPACKSTCFVLAGTCRGCGTPARC
jgi:hypothetical protein